MIIKEFKVHQIAIADPPLRSSYGLHAPYALRTILELKSDDGIIGITETYGGEAPARALEQLRSQIVGANPYRLTGFLSPMVGGKGGGDARSQTFLVPGENPLDETTRTYAAIEVACLDLIGKSAGPASARFIPAKNDQVRGGAICLFRHDCPPEKPKGAEGPLCGWISS